MEFRALQLLITDEDVNALATKHAPADAPFENLQLRFTAEGLVAKGSYPALLLKVSFETVWALSIEEGRVSARLASLRVAGLPASKFQGMILSMARDALMGRPGVTVTDDAILLDAEELLRREGLNVKLNLKAIRCVPGGATIEGGAP
jgi:hypothetical protein